MELFSSRFQVKSYRIGSWLKLEWGLAGKLMELSIQANSKKFKGIAMQLKHSWWNFFSSRFQVKSSRIGSWLKLNGELAGKLMELSIQENSK